MSYLHIGKNVMVSRSRIIGVFDLDITSQSPRTHREFLERAEKDGVVLDACDDIPKSFLVCDHPYHKQLGLYLPAESHRRFKSARKTINLPSPAGRKPKEPMSELEKA